MPFCALESIYFFKSLSLLFLASLFEALKTPRYTLTLQKNKVYIQSQTKTEKHVYRPFD